MIERKSGTVIHLLLKLLFNTPLLDHVSSKHGMDYIMQKNSLNNTHHFSGVPCKQQLRHAFLHSMHTLVNEKIACIQRKNL